MCYIGVGTIKTFKAPQPYAPEVSDVMIPAREIGLKWSPRMDNPFYAQAI